MNKTKTALTYLLPSLASIALVVFINVVLTKILNNQHYSACLTNTKLSSITRFMVFICALGSIAAAIYGAVQAFTHKQKMVGVIAVVVAVIVGFSALFAILSVSGICLTRSV